MKILSNFVAVQILVCSFLLSGCLTNASDTQENSTYVNTGSLGLKLLSPVPGKTYYVGDTLKIQWAVDTTKIFNSLHFDISFDEGQNWTTLNWDTELERILPKDTLWHKGNVGTYHWIIPKEYRDPQYRITYQTVSTKCRVKIWEYDRLENQDKNLSNFNISLK